MNCTYECEACLSELSGIEDTKDCESCDQEVCDNCASQCRDVYCLNWICASCNEEYSYCREHQKENKHVS